MLRQEATSARWKVAFNGFLRARKSTLADGASAEFEQQVYLEVTRHFLLEQLLPRMLHPFEHDVVAIHQHRRWVVLGGLIQKRRASSRAEWSACP